MTWARRAAIVAVAMLATFAADPAFAGGGWWSSLSLKDGVVAPGQRVEASGRFLFRSLEAAELALAADHFRVYVIPDFASLRLGFAETQGEYRRAWRSADVEGIDVGPVGFGGRDANLARARVSFVLPELPAGRYALMACDPGCDTPMGDITPTTFRVVSDPYTARLANRLERFDTKLEGIGSLSSSIAAARADLARTERDLERVETAADAPPAPVRRAALPWWSFAGWFVAGLGAGAALLRRRRARSQALLPVEPPDEMRELPRSEELVGRR